MTGRLRVFLGLAAFALGLGAEGAGLSITKAEWMSYFRQLRVEGTAPVGASVTVTSATSGAALGSATTGAEGTWRVVKSSPWPVPCTVRASAGGQQVERRVSGAPTTCDVGASPVLTGLEVTGPDTVNEGSTGSFTATARFGNGTTKVVTSQAVWSENSPSATIAGGVLTAGAVGADQTVTVSASYTAGSVTKSGSKSATIVNLAPTLAGLAISGPATVNEGGTAAYVATATFSDGSTQNVTPAATWSDNSAYASIAGGLLTAGSVSSNETVTVSATYASGSVTKAASKSVTIVNLAPTLASLAISGPATVNEGGTAAYVATATFSDGSTQNVTSAATWSENSAYASIAGGVLTAGQVSADEPVLVSATFVSGGVTREASTPVTILNQTTLTGSHVGRFAAYEGTKTCLTCHLSEAMAMHGSVHYQWQGDASEAVGLSIARAGKLGGINDFCIYPDINWIGKLTNLDGKQVDGGCARCHSGLGAKPAPEPTQAQLENIDCLLCHSKSYKRTVAQVDGVWKFVPDAATMSVSLQQAAVDVTKPDSGTCLNCHTRAGGGNNFKRGDIEEAHRTATAAFDVHMAPKAAGGAGLSCLSCHTTVDHRVAGRGTDMRERDVPDRVACANCHSSTPHDDAKLDKHTARVSCTVCHIPEFAKVAATDMYRDFSAPADVVAATRLYEPHMLMASHVRPVYRFFNGTSQFYEFGAEAVPDASGRVVMSKPLGSIADRGAQIIALKHHAARQPIDPVTRRLLPLKIGIFFQTGDLATAVKQGVAGVGWPDNGFDFAETERFMGLYHEVSPEDEALECRSCHGGGRMDFAALGYTPLETRNGKPLCTSCHSSKTGDFFKIHEKHVTDKRYDCSTCHTFSKAQ